MMLKIITIIIITIIIIIITMLEKSFRSDFRRIYIKTAKTSSIILGVAFSLIFKPAPRIKPTL